MKRKVYFYYLYCDEEDMIESAWLHEPTIDFRDEENAKKDGYCEDDFAGYIIVDEYDSIIETIFF